MVEGARLTDPFWSFAGFETNNWLRIWTSTQTFCSTTTTGWRSSGGHACRARLYSEAETEGNEAGARCAHQRTRPSPDVEDELEDFDDTTP